LISNTEDSRGPRAADETDETRQGTRHFRVVVIVPEEGDQVDLSDPARGRRWNYKFVDADSGGSWKVTELWP
jgi:pyridoxamine 5'-phosphate oxidase